MRCGLVFFLRRSGGVLGDRSCQSTKKLGTSLPDVYRKCAVIYTDFWESSKTVIASECHRPVGKETGQTNPNLENFF